MKTLNEKVFAAWPLNTPAVEVHKEGEISRDGITMSAFDFASQEPFHLRLYLVHREGLRTSDLQLVALHVLDDDGWLSFEQEYYSRFNKLFVAKSAMQPAEQAFESEKKMLESNAWAMAYIAPRGVGPTAWTGSDKAQVQRLRRFYLLGETKESGQVWDIRRTVQALRSIRGLDQTKLWLASGGTMAVNTLYASLFEDKITRLDLNDPPVSHMNGPTYFNVLRYLDIPQAAAMASERCRVVIYSKAKEPWGYLVKTSDSLGWPKNVQLREPQ
jgi:hypothetical protein